jgi:hypothetical protein
MKRPKVEVEFDGFEGGEGVDCEVGRWVVLMRSAAKPDGLTGDALKRD